MGFKIDGYSLTLKLILILIPILFIVGIIVPYALGLGTFAIYSLYITIPLTLSLLAYFLIKNRKEVSLEFSKRFKGLLEAAYVIIYPITICLLLFFEVRMTIYFVLISVLFTLVLLKILILKDTDSKTILFLQIILLFLNIDYGTTLKYPQFIGRTDPIAHSWFIELLVQTGKINERVFQLYADFPLWHTFVASVVVLTKATIETYKMMYLLNGLINSCVIVIAFYVSKTIFKNDKIAFFTSLLLSIFPNFIVNTLQSIPRGINGSLIVVAIFLLLNSESVVFKGLSIIIGLFMILFHHASMVSIIIIYSLIFTLQLFFKNKSTEKITSLKMITIVTLATLSYWALYSNSLFTDILTSLNFGGTTSISTSSTLQLNEIFNYVQFSPYIFLTALGVVAILYLRLDKKALIIGLSGLGLLALSIPNPLSSISSVITRLVFNRFSEYTSIFIIVTAAVGLYYLLERTPKSMKLIIVALLMIACFISIDNDFTASDNPLIKRQFYSFYVSTPETTAVNTLTEISDGSFIMADYPMFRVITHSGTNQQAHLLEADRTGSTIFKVSERDIIFIRDSELAKRPLHLFVTAEYAEDPAWNEGSFVYFDATSPMFREIEKYNRSYDNGSVTAYN
jgi:hypothetical protein